MSLLNKQNILAAADIQFKTLLVPEWGGEVRLRSMIAADRDAYEQWLISLPEVDGQRRVENVRARFAVMSIVDENDAPVFTDADIADLTKKSASALGRIYDAVIELNAIARKDVEELAKN